MAIALGGSNQGFNSTTDGTTFSSPAFVPAANVLLLIHVQAVRASLEPEVPTITHNGISAVIPYTFYYTTSGGNRRKLYIAGLNTGASPASSAIAVTFASTHTLCQCQARELTGTDVINGTTQTFIQSATTVADTIGTSDSITLAAAGHADNRPFAVWGHGADEVTTVPRTSWTEIDEHSNNTPNTALETQWRSDTFETTASASWTISSGYGGLAFEIKASAAAAVGGADPFGMFGFFGG